ncbi:MAG TPA: hypothetical protein VHL80_06375 [Polyangia bacterium]|nr:hypothetical protein [Polyangia bacterium]
MRAWGFSTVGMVAAKFRLLERATVPREVIACRALAALPDIEWLDEAREWFTLLDRESAMRAAIEKILAVAGVVERHELEEALGKRHSFGGAPPAVVRAYVEALAAQVLRRGALDASITSEELEILQAFDRTGPSLGLAELRLATRERLPEATLAHVLRASPLFVRASRGTYRVVGSFPAAPYVTLAGSTTIVAPAQ